jgi:hypothetical protein
MNRISNREPRIIVCLSLLFILLSYSSKLSAQEWVVPPDKAKVLSPFKFSDETRKTGENLYTTYCKQCHGDPGKGNVIALVPPPPDPATPKMQKNTDGGIFYKVTEGKGPMPSFKNILTAFNIWNIISYLRSFNPQYVQQVVPEEQGGASMVKNTHIQLSWVPDYFQVVAIVSGEKDNVIKPVTGTEVKLFAKRYFGTLLIDAAKTTDSIGKAVFNFPTDLPGDSSGFVSMFAKLSDEASYGEVIKDTSLNVGVPTWKPPLNENRAMWNVVQKAPLWILLTYSIVVLTVWGLILYVIYQLYLIFNMGKLKNRD